MNSPSRYIPFVQEAAYSKLAIANQAPEKIPLPEFFEAARFTCSFLALSYGDDPYLKAFLRPEGRCCFQLSPSARK